jgi:ribosomal protein S24E
MEVKIVSAKENALLKRKEVTFTVEHGSEGRTPPRLEVKKALAAELKVDEGLVFVRAMRTRTGTSSAVGVANAYESAEQARLVEPEYIRKRNSPPEEPKEEVTA